MTFYEKNLDGLTIFHSATCGNSITTRINTTVKDSRFLCDVSMCFNDEAYEPLGGFDFSLEGGLSHLRKLRGGAMQTLLEAITNHFKFTLNMVIFIDMDNGLIWFDIEGDNTPIEIDTVDYI